MGAHFFRKNKLKIRKKLPFTLILSDCYQPVARHLVAIARLSPDYRPIIAAILTDIIQIKQIRHAHLPD